MPRIQPVLLTFQDRHKAFSTRPLPQPIKGIHKLKVKVHTSPQLPIPRLPRGLARRPLIQNAVQDVAYHDPTAGAELTVGRRWPDPIKEADEEAQLLDDARAGDFRVAGVGAIEGWFEKLKAEDAACWGGVGHYLVLLAFFFGGRIVDSQAIHSRLARVRGGRGSSTRAACKTPCRSLRQ